MDIPYKTAVGRLPLFLRLPLEQVAPRVEDGVQEIRLRSGRGVCFTLPQGQAYLSPQGRLCPEADAMVLTHSQVQSCFYALCADSVHSYERELAQGYFTLPGGHRVGVAGVWGAQGFRYVTSLNVRVARGIRVPLPPRLAQRMGEGGVLLAGPPGSGKTTLLRSLAFALCARGARVCVVDEREELMPCTSQGFAFAMPQNCDVLSGLPKAQSVLMALRSLSPEVLLCDEIGDMQEVRALEAGLNAGARLVCSMHTANMEELRRRPQYNALCACNAFSTVALLEGSLQPGRIREVLTP